MDNKKVAILTRPRCRSPLFLALSLSRMLNRLGVAHKLFNDGISLLETSDNAPFGLKHFFQTKKNNRLAEELSGYDLIILADTIRAYSSNVDLSLIKDMGKPILYYGVFYVGGSNYWLDRLPDNPLIKFDAHLTVSAVNDVEALRYDYAFPIGADLSSMSFQGKRERFVALLDYEQEGYEAERDLHKRVLNRLNIPFIELNQEYTFQQIAQLYRKCSVAFVACPESFGMPVVEQQFLGAQIICPKKYWVKRHALNVGYSVFNEATSKFSSNFLFYEGEEELINKLSQLKQDYVPSEIRSTLLETQPELCLGNLGSLWNALKPYV